MLTGKPNCRHVRCLLIIASLCPHVQLCLQRGRTRGSRGICLQPALLPPACAGRGSPGRAAALGLLSLTHLWRTKVDAAALAPSSAPASLWAADSSLWEIWLESISPKSLKLKEVQGFKIQGKNPAPVKCFPLTAGWTGSHRAQTTRQQKGDHQWIGHLWGSRCYKPLAGTGCVTLGQGKAVHFSSAFILFLFQLFWNYWKSGSMPLDFGK